MNNLTINEIMKRDLEKCYFSISFYPSIIYYNEGQDYIKERKVYTIIGCNIYGVRKYITSIFASDFSKGSDWYNLFSLWKKKGIETIFFAIIPNNKCIKETLKLAFPNIKTYTSYFETINKIDKFFSCSYSNDLLQKFKNIYLANDINDFEFKKQFFIDETIDKPFVFDLIANDFNIITDYIKIPISLRKHLFSFYFAREITKKLNILSHSTSYFNSLLEYIELLLPTIQTMEVRMYSSKSEWNSVITCIYNENKDLLISYL
ncbi:MAG: transposase [Bacilli bacterium]